MVLKKEKQNKIEGIGDLSNISEILRETRSAILKGDYFKLGYLSNSTIHSATVNQDSLNIIIAVLVYTINKIMNRKAYQNMEGWDIFYKSLLKNLDLMISYSDKNETKKVLECAGEIRNVLNEVSGDLGSYIKDVFLKAEINKAFKIYEHGISSQKTAELLGVSLWDLASYIGQSSISEAKFTDSLSEENRIKYTFDFFK